MNIGVKLAMRENIFFGEGARLIQPRLCLTWEDPADLDTPAKVTTPSPQWLAIAFAGGLLPPVEVYQQMALELTATFEDGSATTIHVRGVNAGDARHDAYKRGGRVTNERVLFHELHTAQPIGPMTEEQALEYLSQTVLPRRVREYQGNRPVMRIVGRDALPADRFGRNAWRMNLNGTEPLTVDMEAARALIQRNKPVLAMQGVVDRLQTHEDLRRYASKLQGVI
jgi:pimeloyl-ACP methyl ester carboxylesterase